MIRLGVPTTNRGSDEYLRWRKMRRQVARRHHPDVGGDLEGYLRRMHEVDEQFSTGRRSMARVKVSGPAFGSLLSLGPPRRLPGARRIRVIRRHGRKAVARARARLPRGLPGARRYFDL